MYIIVFYRTITYHEDIVKLYPTAVCGKWMDAVDVQVCEIAKLSVPNGDVLLAEGLLRSALHFAGNRNAYTAVCRENDFRETLLLLGFAEQDGVFTGEIPTLLLGSCCKHNHGVNG